MNRSQRWMLFLDGENFTIQAQKIANKKGVSLIEGDLWQKDVFLWIPNVDPVSGIFYLTVKDRLHIPYDLEPRSIRSYYYTALKGSEELILEVRKKIRKQKFEPEVFKKISGKSKGVDITITKDVLSHAFRDNYDIAVIIAGDRDYIPLIEEIKRLGKIVCIYFFDEVKEGLSQELKLAADHFGSINNLVFNNWEYHINRINK